MLSVDFLLYRGWEQKGSGISEKVDDGSGAGTEELKVGVKEGEVESGMGVKEGEERMRQEE